MVITAEKFTPLDLVKIKERGITGVDLLERAEEILELIYMGFVPYLIGPSGSGKTHFAKLVMAKYCERVGCNLYYFQNSPEVTKTKAIAGTRLIAGSTQDVLGIVATAMSEGAAVIIDELTHARDASGITMYNTVLDEDSVTATGDMFVEANKYFRIMFCSNDDKHVGNIKIPQSTGQRFYPYNFDYPLYETELAVAIQMASDKYERGQIFKSEEWAALDPPKVWNPKPFSVPESFARLVTGYVRAARTESYPLSIRNMSQALVRAQVAYVFKNKRTPFDPKTIKMDDVFEGPGVAVAPLTKRLYDYMYGDNPAVSRNELADPRVIEMKKYVSYIGGQKVRNEILASVGHGMPIDGQGVHGRTVKDELAGKLW